MGLVRSVFSKSRAGVVLTDINEKKINGREKKRWGIVRSYFRENEYSDSVGADAEEDANSSDSAHGSEATVNNEIMNKGERGEGDHQRQLQSLFCDKKEDGTKVWWSGVDEDSAAKLIQSVFRAFLARRRGQYGGWNKQGEAKGGGVHRENGIDNSEGKPTPTSQKTSRAKNRLAKPKEEWDSTVSSSTVSQLRNQHRLEAAMKREKALAYAFSQQLRTFNSKKKNRTQPRGTDHQTEWSWLEKWIASHKTVNPVPLKEQPTSLNKLGANNFQTESCGSNEVILASTKKLAATKCPAATQKITRVITKADAVSSSKKGEIMKKKVIIIRSGSGKIKDGAVDINRRPMQGIVA